MRIPILFLFAACASSAADYTTYIGDAFTYNVTALTTDSNGNTYLTGSRAVGSATGLFVTKIDAFGNVTLLAAVDLTLLATSEDQLNSANAIAVDSSGNIFIAGVTIAAEFPLVNPLQIAPAINGQNTGFLMKLAPNGDVLFSTFLGGTKGTSAMNGLAVDLQGNVYVTGTTNASDYPSTPGLPADPASNPPVAPVSAAWFAKISGDGSRIIYAGGISSSVHECGLGSTCFLNGITTTGVAIAVDPAGDAYLAGNTYGTLTGTPGALLTSGIGGFAMKVNAAGNGIAYLTLLGTANFVTGGVAPGSEPGNLVSAIAVDSAGDVYLAGETNDPNFPATAGSFQSSLPNGPGANSFPPPPFSGFVAELNPTGSATIWASFLGGSSNVGATIPRNLAVDASGDVWISGTTTSLDFPATFDFSNGEFLTEFNSAGSALLYSAQLPFSSVAAGLAIDASGIIHAAGETGIVSSFSQALAPGLAKAPEIFGLSSSAGGGLGGRVVPGELISIYGLNLGPQAPATAQVTTAGYIPTTLAGAQMTINGTLAPLLYVSATQINAVAPIELTAGSAVVLSIVTNNTSAPDFRVEVDSAAPQVFANKSGTAAAINQDGTINSASNPASLGSYVAIWATGTGVSSGRDGQIVESVQSSCACFLTEVLISAEPQPFFQIPPPVKVTYAGAAPGLVNGVVQINFQVPSDGVSQFALTVDGQTSGPFMIWVKPD
jgi:uncharacterized protein (TIGR03437 family)